MDRETKEVDIPSEKSEGPNYTTKGDNLDCDQTTKWTFVGQISTSLGDKVNKKIP